ncbi:MAG: hypothetical protein ABL993_00915 [Vicinamibacterales bacterium]
MATEIVRNLSVNELLGDVMRSMGLTPPATMVGSSNSIANQLVELSDEVGIFLLGLHAWKFFEREQLITGDGVSVSFPVPEDWEAYISTAMWDRSSSTPVAGPLDEFEWQAIKARTAAGATFTSLFRMEDENVIFYQPPASGHTLYFAYRGRGWLRNGASYYDAIHAADDTILHEPYLFKCALRERWREEKGFDTTLAQRRTAQALALAKAKNKPGRDLSLSRNSGFRLISMLNVPDTGYGL